MEDALRTVPGITFSAVKADSKATVRSSAGLPREATSTATASRSGLVQPATCSARTASKSTRALGFRFRRGSTGGAINTVSKLPTGATFVDGMVSGTTTGGYRAEVDASGKKDNWSARIAAMYQDVPTADRDNVYTKRWGVAPSVQYTFTPDTKVLFSYVYQGEESIPITAGPILRLRYAMPSTGALTSSGILGNGAATPPVSIPRNNCSAPPAARSQI